MSAVENGSYIRHSRTTLAHAHGGCAHSRGGYAIALSPMADPHMPHGGSAHPRSGSAVRLTRPSMKLKRIQCVATYGRVDNMASFQTSHS